MSAGRIRFEAHPGNSLDHSCGQVICVTPANDNERDSRMILVTFRDETDESLTAEAEVLAYLMFTETAAMNDN